MEHHVTTRFRGAVAHALMALVVMFVSIPYTLHACTELSSTACTCCCSHEASAVMSCCTNEQAEPAMPDMAATATPDCCFTIYIDSSAPFLPARVGSEPMPEAATVVIDRLPAPAVEARHVSSTPPFQCDGARPHLVLCQLLI